MNCDALNQYFGIDEQLRFVEENGQILIEVSNTAASARLSLQGGQLISWIPTGQDEVIWLSDEARFAPQHALRGGIPICWPWFGAHADEAEYPAHGYVRRSDWEVLVCEALSESETRIGLRLLASVESERYWPYVATLECYFTIGQQLKVELVTLNDGADSFTITEALHTYFRVADVRQVEVSGLDKQDYLDKVRGFSRFTQNGSVRFTEEVDRVYVNHSAECVIHDPLLNRRIHIHKQGSESTIVWNPWEEKSASMGDMGEEGYLRMLCVESGNAFDNAVTVEPGETHRLCVQYSLS